MGAQAAARCADFGWQPRGALDPSLVAETAARPAFGLGRAWSNSASYQLAADPGLTYLVYTVEGGFDFDAGGDTVHADPGTMTLFEASTPTVAQTTADTARFVWYFEPTMLHPQRSRFRFREPIPVQNAPLHALAAMTHFTIDSGLPSSDTARRHLGIALEHLVSAALDEAGGPGLADDSRHRDGLFMAAQRSIETHFHDPAFNVARLSKDLAVGVRTLHGTFSRLGTTPRREIERRRVTEANRLILTASMAASEVVDRAGFSSLKQLNRARGRQVPYRAIGDE